MANNLPREFMEKYGVDSDEVWQVRPGIYAIKHSALERVAVEQKIKFDRPAVLEMDTANKVAAMIVFGSLGERTEWSTGEATPHNNKNAYPVAMSEKRARDRVILKLLNAHGALYSEAEADDFQQRQNPHVTRPEDIGPAIEYDQHGEPIDNIPRGDDRIERMPKAKARSDYAAAQNEMHATKTPAELEAWGKKNANRIESYPSDWQEILRGQYSEHMTELRKGKAA